MNTQLKNEKNNDEDNRKNKRVNWIQLIQSYLLIFIFHFIFILIIGYFISPWSKVDTVTVEGNEDVYDQMIIDKSSIKIGESVFKSKQKFDQSESDIVKELTQVSDVQITIEELNKVMIRVEEFSTVAYIAKEGAYLRVLEDGSVLDELYTISLGNQLVLSKFKEGDILNLMIQELKEIDQAILNLISEIELVEDRTNPLFIRVYMNNGNRVLAKIPEFSQKILYYPQMVQAVEGQKGVFDMEVGIYFTPFKDSEDPEAGVNENEEQNLGNLTE